MTAGMSMCQGSGQHLGMGVGWSIPARAAAQIQLPRTNLRSEDQLEKGAKERVGPCGLSHVAQTQAAGRHRPSAPGQA